MKFRKAVGMASLSIVMVLGLIALAAAADPLNSWRPRNPLPQLGNHLYGIASSPKTCVVVGEGGRILTSADGFTWQERVSRTTDAMYGVAYGVVGGKGLWVAVGDKGTIQSSPDGIKWTLQNEGYSDEDHLRAIVFGKGTKAKAPLFVAVGKTGRILTSKDGIVWTYQVSGTGSFLNDVRLLNGTFYATGTSPSNAIHPTILTSQDGVKWNWAPVSAAYNTGFKGIAYGEVKQDSGEIEKVWVVVGNGPTANSSNPYALYSTDSGATWTPCTLPSPPQPYLLNGIVFANKQFVAVDSNRGVFTSSDGKVWAKSYFPITGFGAYNFQRITYFNKNYITLGYDGKLMTSPDAASWTERPSGAQNFIYDVEFADDVYVAVGWGGKILTSTDRITWEERKAAAGDSLFGVTHGNGSFVAVGSRGKIVTSSTSKTWKSVKSGYKGPLYGVAFGKNLFVTVGSSGKILTSPDGVTWTARTSKTTKTLFGVTYGNGVFVAVGEGGTIVTSSNGTSWTDNTPETSTSCLYGVTFGGNSFVAVGDNGAVWSSPDQVSWTKKTGLPYKSTSYSLRAVTYVNNTFVAVGCGGDVLVSQTPDGSSWKATTSNIVYSLFGIGATPDGQVAVVGAYATILSSDDCSADIVTWTIRSSGTYNELNGIARGKGKFVAVGQQGVVLTSTNGTVWDIKNLLPISQQLALNGIAFGENTFVAVGGTPYTTCKVFTSKDAVTWNEMDVLPDPVVYPDFYPPLPTVKSLNAVTYGGGQFVAAGADGICLTSKDGKNWFYYLLESAFNTKGVAYGNGTFVMVGDYAPYTRTILSSEDGIYWTMSFAPYVPQSPTSGFTGVAYGNDVFVTVGPSVKIVISTEDAPEFGWTQKPLVDFTGSFDFSGITFGGNKTFVSVGTYGKILTSPDGAHWTFRRSGTKTDLCAMVYGASPSANTYVAVGAGGIILQSGAVAVP